MDPIRVVIAEDEEAVRHALVDLVSSDPLIAVVGAAADADEAIEMARDTQPDVALVDVKMPGGGGPRATREIRTCSPSTHVLALSAYEDRATVLEMLRAGVIGYIVKGTPADEILDAIHLSVQGQGRLSVEVTAGVIHELAMLLERSERLAEDLRELDRTKSDLIQVLSHELFTPLTTIQGYAATVAQHGDELSREEIKAMAAGVTRAGGRIARLVGNLDASARLDREEVDVPTSPAKAASLLDAARSEFADEAERIVLPSRGLERTVWADVGLASRALVVTLENALQLSAEDSPVEIEIEGDRGTVEFCVLDRGPGVPPELRERIFQPLTQADTSTTRAHAGIGVGLYLARRIMTAHRGTIDVSPREGGGSIFRLTFPAAG